jgi:hypothetical protein
MGDRVDGLMGGTRVGDRRTCAQPDIGGRRLGLDQERDTGGRRLGLDQERKVALWTAR